MAEKFVSENPSAVNALEFHEQERTHSPIDYSNTITRLYRNQLLENSSKIVKL